MVNKPAEKKNEEWRRVRGREEGGKRALAEERKRRR